MTTVDSGGNIKPRIIWPFMSVFRNSKRLNSLDSPVRLTIMQSKMNNTNNHIMNCYAKKCNINLVHIII